MFKGKFVALSLLAAALLCWQIMPAAVDSANSGIVDPCSTTATSAGGCLIICPQGDGTTLGGAGATISVTVKDATGAPIAGIPAADFWLIGCNDALTLCGGSGSSNADAATDALGQTTISGGIAAGGCDVGLSVVVQGVVVADPAFACTSTLCLAITPVSPDNTGDLAVDLLDFSVFGAGFTSPPKPYNACLDYDCNGIVDILDFSVFGSHWLHVC